MPAAVVPIAVAEKSLPLVVKLPKGQDSVAHATRGCSICGRMSNRVASSVLKLKNLFTCFRCSPLARELLFITFRVFSIESFQSGGSR